MCTAQLGHASMTMYLNTSFKKLQCNPRRLNASVANSNERTTIRYVLPPCVGKACDQEALQRAVAHSHGSLPTKWQTNKSARCNIITTYLFSAIALAERAQRRLYCLRLCTAAALWFLTGTARHALPRALAGGGPGDASCPPHTRKHNKTNFFEYIGG